MKCIYCNNNSDLNCTHIIPDAMTGNNIMYQNSVCSYEHNTKFSEDFESNIIKKLAPILSNLNIKSSKGSNVPDYNIKVLENDNVFETTYYKFSNVIRGNTIIKNTSGDTFFGTMQALSKIPNKYNRIFIDNNESYKTVTLYDVEVFFTCDIFRLVSKIAYEWFCKEYEIKEKVYEFQQIINFIVNGGENEFVTLVYEENVYNNLHRFSNLGSHILCLNVHNDTIEVMVSLFGIATYIVNLGKYNISKLEYKCLYFESTIYSKSYKFKTKNLYELLCGTEHYIYNETSGKLCFNENDDKRYTNKNVILYNYITNCYADLNKKIKILSDDEFKNLLIKKVL